MRPDLSLKAHASFPAPSGPVALIIMDGVGIGALDEANAWHLAQTPTLDALMQGPRVGTLLAHGTAVGMPSDADMGNSEVGHNAMGAGRVFDQGAKLVEEALRSGTFFESDTWSWLLEACQAGHTLHFMGLLSDGNVHSHIDHLLAMLERAFDEGGRRLRVHILLDGRDVGQVTALTYVRRLETCLASLRAKGADACIASGGGRMRVTMDRYESDWRIVARGWRAHVLGEGRLFSSATEAIETYRREDEGLGDQFLPSFVIGESDEDGVTRALGTIEDGDAVVFFNFRGDRALEITRTFESGPEFDAFERERCPDVRFAGMMQYDGDLMLPTRFLVHPPQIDRVIGAYVAQAGLRQLALSETHKFGHVTYFFNGNRSEMFDPALERYVEVPSGLAEPGDHPEMQATAITEAVLAHAREFQPHFIRVNFANGDMVGHSGSLASAIAAMECLDGALSALMAGLLPMGATLIITADHGNCEEMAEKDKEGEFRRDLAGALSPKTSHTLNPVPVIIVGESDALFDADLRDAGIASLAATVLNLLGFEAPADYAPSLVRPSGA